MNTQQMVVAGEEDTWYKRLSSYQNARGGAQSFKIIVHQVSKTSASFISDSFPIEVFDDVERAVEDLLSDARVPLKIWNRQTKTLVVFPRESVQFVEFILGKTSDC